MVDEGKKPDSEYRDDESDPTAASSGFDPSFGPQLPLVGGEETANIQQDDVPGVTTHELNEGNTTGEASDAETEFYPDEAGYIASKYAPARTHKIKPA